MPKKPNSNENNNSDIEAPQIRKIPSHALTPAEALILKHQSLKEEHWKYLVCDTNIWITNLPIIRSILNDEKMVEYKIYISHMVGVELDNLKNGSNQDICKAARTAIRTIHDLLEANPRVIQEDKDQSRTAETFHYDCIKADDHILASCIMLRRQGKSVKICTNDKNLKCNAIANNISRYPPLTPQQLRDINESK